MPSKSVPYGVAGREAGVEVDVALDEGRYRELARAVDDLFAFARRQVLRDFLKLSVRYADVLRFRRVFDEDIFYEHCGTVLS